jgi:integrase
MANNFQPRGRNDAKHSVTTTAPMSANKAWPMKERKKERNGIVSRSRIKDFPRIRLSAGVHPKIAQERLGHASITTTLDLYSHVTDTMQGDAAARLDAAFQLAQAGLDAGK